MEYQQEGISFVRNIDPSPELNVLLEQLVKNHSAVVLTESTSNQYHSKFFNHIDRYIFDFTEEDFKNTLRIY